MGSFKPLVEWSPIEDLADSVNTGKSSAKSLVERSLKAINDSQEYNALITVSADYARARANEIDNQIKSGKSAGPLAGVPFIAKDNYLTAGVRTTAASNILKDYTPPYSATVIDKLESAGAILVGKANLDAFAHGSSTENSDFGPTLNPYDPTRVPGGSSGGSAAAVALGLAPFSLGTDTGGSIRLPASFCGVVGLKPSYGLVSRYGVIAMASSTDCMGPLTNSVKDSAYVLDVMAGQDDHDSTTIKPESSYQTEEIKIDKLKIGVIKEHLGEGLKSDVRRKIDTVIKSLEAKGAKIEEVSIPLSQVALACYYIIVPAEVSSNLSRYDGVRYGLSETESKDLISAYEQTRSKGFNAENKRRIMTGNYVLSSGYYEAYYKKAMTVRTKLIEEFNKAMKGYDVLIGPTAPSTAFKLGANTDDPLAMYMTDIMTVMANLVGNPAISIPAGLEADLPVGLQLMTGAGSDRKLLSIAAKFAEVLND